MQKRKKIVIVSHYASSIAKFRGSLIEAIGVSGNDISVLAPDWSPLSERAVKNLGAETVSYQLSRTSLNPFVDLKSLWELWRYFRKQKPDVVFTYSAKTNIWGMAAAFFARVPRRVVMVEGMGYAFTEVDKAHSIKRRLLSLLLSVLYSIVFKIAHNVVVLNADDARDLQRLCGLTTIKTLVLGGIGVILRDWPVQSPHVQPVTFTLIARLLKEKGVIEYLKAARIVKAQYPKVRFFLLGGLDENPGALNKADIQSWLEDGIVEWPGQVDVKQWLAQTSVYVLPSYREGLPRSTQEAMAMGRPVITTDVPGCRETVIDGVNGFIVPPRDFTALALAMMRFIEHPNLIEIMGAESRKIAVDRFDVDKINPILMDILGIESTEFNERPVKILG